MACRLDGAKPLLELDPWEQTSEILIGIQTFSFQKMHLKMASAKWRPFVSVSMTGANETDEDSPSHEILNFSFLVIAIC